MGLFDFFRQRNEPMPANEPYAPFNVATINIDGVNALNCPPYMAAVTLLATSLAKLGRHVMSDGQRIVNHPIEKLLNEPNPFIDGYTLFLQAEINRLNTGNGYIHITRDERGIATALMLIDPGNVTMHMTNGGFYYTLGSDKQVSAKDMIHVRNSHLDSEMRGVGYYVILKEQLKLWLSAQKHQTEYFELGAFPKALLESDEPLSEDAKRIVRKEWQKGMSEQNTKLKIAVSDKRLSYKPLAVNFKEMELNVMYGEMTKQIASAFNLAPYLLAHDGSKNTYSNIESQNMQFLQNALMPGITAWEYQLKKLFMNDGNSVKFNIETLLRADSSSRAERLTKLVQAQIIDVDEARAYEGLPPKGLQQGAKHNDNEAV